jgi:hypothetical protein
MVGLAKAWAEVKRSHVSYPDARGLAREELHLPAFDHSANTGLIAIHLTGAATLLLLLIPLIAGLRHLPRLLRAFWLV